MDEVDKGEVSVKLKERANKKKTIEVVELESCLFLVWEEPEDMIIYSIIVKNKKFISRDSTQIEECIHRCWKKELTNSLLDMSK